MYYKDLLRYRQAWLGVAMLWIIMFHCPVNWGTLGFTAAIGYGGVDICFFASGIGCFYSLSSDSNVLNFMKRRMKRLAPTYLVFIVVWLLYQYAIGQLRRRMIIGNLLAIQSLTAQGHYFNWYISAILLFYLFAPYIKELTVRTGIVGKLAFFVYLMALSVAFWRSATFLVMVTRLPVFFMGMVFADMCQKNMRITGKHIAALTLSFILGIVSIRFFFSHMPGYLDEFGFYWYPFILIAPPLCVAISYIAMLLEKTKLTKLILSFLQLCGGYSFEIYLLHILLISCITDYMNAQGLAGVSNLVWIAGGVLLAVSCFLLRRSASLLMAFTQKYLCKR